MSAPLGPVMDDFVDACDADWHAMSPSNGESRRCDRCVRDVVPVRNLMEFIDALCNGACVAVERSLPIGPIPIDDLDDWLPTTRGVLYDPPQKDGEFDDQA